MANYTQEGYDLSQNQYRKGTTTGPNQGWPANYWCSETMRSIAVAYTNFFNDLHVVRKNKYGEPIKDIQVPLKFGPRMKSFDMRKQLEAGKEYYISYPNLTWRFTSTGFDPQRFSGQYAERAFYNDTMEKMDIPWKMTDQFWKDVQPVPVNIGITMELKCDLLNDAMDVNEQITTRFTPECYLNIKEFWFFNKRRSIKMLLEGEPSWSFENDAMGEEDKREIIVSYNFQVQAYFYKPIKHAAIIDKINTYVQAHHSEEVWHEEIFGNYDGSVKNRYDFEDEYGAALLPESAMDDPILPIYDKATSAYIQNYTWHETGNYKFYPEGTKFIKQVVSTWNPETSGFDVEQSYYDVPVYGKDPHQKIEIKTLYDSYGDPYSGYYTTEHELITEQELLKRKLKKF